MVAYPSTADIVEANKIALRITRDKHPHRLRGLAEGIQYMIEEIKKDESRGVTYQAARFMRQLTTSHFFDGANHRTAYLVTLQFLTQNGIRLKAEQAHAVDEFMEEIGSKGIEEVQEWVEHSLM